MNQYVIYFDTEKYPKKYVLRQHITKNGRTAVLPVICIDENIVVCRNSLPLGVKPSKVKEDNRIADISKIIESWA